MAVSWMKKGAASAAAAKQEEAEAQKRKEEQGKLFRFWLKDKEEARITFVDGELSDEGYLLPPRFYEHNLQQGGKYNNYYVCPEKTHPESGERCPICEDADRPALVALFTIIDHREFTSKDGSKTYRDTRKILAAKPITFELLNKIAIKRGGLRGNTFDVSRLGEKSAAVGSMFDWVEKNDPEKLAEMYVREWKDQKTGKMIQESSFKPADYETEILYRDEATLRKMGFGKGVTAGSSPMKSTTKPKTDAGESEYEEHL